MNGEFEKLVKQAKEVMGNQRADLNKSMNLLLNDETETEKNKVYVKGLIDRLNTSIDSGDKESLTSLRDELVNKIKKQ